MSGKRHKMARKELRMAPDGPSNGPPQEPILRVEEPILDRNDPQFPPELSDRQVAALPYLAAAATNEEGVRMAEISPTTFKRWRRDPVFRDELRRMREDAASLAFAELNGLALKSMATLTALLEDPSPSVRAQAVRIALSTGIRAGEAARNTRRLNQLQKALTLLKNLK